MKHILFLFIAIIFLGCSANNIQVQKNNEGKTTINFKADKKYLLLPIEDTGKEYRVDINVNGKNINHYIIRLAEKKIDYWVPVDISAWKGEQIELLVEGLSDSAICLKQIKQSGIFSFDYNEKYRPNYHFTPYYGWVNDPNGMVYYDGEYHLFYQNNPFGTRWQNMSWGHAVSKDLVTWEYQPVALYPDSLGTIFSGSAVVDENNTAGLKTGKEKTLLAFYTQSERGGQWQSLAYSNDKGRTWTKYSKNPILKHPTARDFRDPKVFWYEPTQRWIMTLAVGQVIEIYSSANAIDWTYESNFGEGYGNHAGVWECPDLFELSVEDSGELKKWVLICNINPGGPSGGSATQYFTGNFDGKTFTCDNKPGETHWMDWGKDHYAAVTWANAPDNRRLSIAWMSNWEYANDIPTINFRNGMTIPRELRLVKQPGGNIILANYPVTEIQKLRGEQRTIQPFTISEEYSIKNLLVNNNGVYELNINIDNVDAEIIGFKLFNNKSESVDICLNIPEGKLYMDRKESGLVHFNPQFAAIAVAPIAKKQTYTFRLLIDKASVELFEAGGETTMTNLIFPEEPYNHVYFYSKGGIYNVNKMEIYNIK